MAKEPGEVKLPRRPIGRAPAPPRCPAPSAPGSRRPSLDGRIVFGHDSEEKANPLALSHVRRAARLLRLLVPARLLAPRGPRGPGGRARLSGPGSPGPGRRVSGAPRFFKAAQAAGIRPLVGAELTLAGGGCLPVLVESRRGYESLCLLITRMKAGVKKGEGKLPLEWLEGSVEGLVALPGVETLGRPPDSDRLARILQAFGASNVFLDVQRHRRREQEAANQALLDMADALGLRAVATNGVRHAVSRGRPLQDVLTCIREKRTLANAGRLLSENAERHLKSPKAMEALFADRPDLLRNNEALSERLEFTLKDLGYRFPRLPGAAGGDAAEPPLPADRGGGARALPALPREGARADRARAPAHREAGARRLLPDRLGHRALLPAGGDPRAGPGLRRQQRGLLQPGHHRGRPGGDGAALRALPLRGARASGRTSTSTSRAATAASG